ncbi:toxin HicA [Burkholderia sp. AU16741]|uniref:toxin HicA n=1 Tax=Burkholderia sp. AU16741 TaxID=2015347 RepID=UPI00117BF491|nr:toxin HicA [Burkholderia sp. AU16741]
MASEWKILDPMRREPANVRFNDLFEICEAPLRSGPPIRFQPCYFKTPWQGDPRVNIQNDRGKAKAYQVRQVLDAIDRLKEQKS